MIEGHVPNHTTENGSLTKGMAVNVITALKPLDPYIYHDTGHGSIYIKFKEAPAVGTVRISDHKGKKKYKYKWNLRSDLFKPIIKPDYHTSIYGEMHQTMRYYYPWSHWEQMVRNILRNYDKCLEYRENKQLMEEQGIEQ